MQWSVVAWSFLLLSGVVGANESIIQLPKNITVTEGGTVRLNCTSVGKTNRSIWAISWYKDVETRAISNTSGDYYRRVQKNSSPGILKESIKITDLKMNETGKYYCRVTVFAGGIYNGHGTEVTVTRRSLVESTAWTLRWQLLIMGVKLASFFVINVAIVFIIRSWESCGFVSRRKRSL